MKRKQRYQLDSAQDPFLQRSGLSPWQARLNQIIFGIDTLPGRIFDIGLLIAIMVSVVTVMLESVSALRVHYGELFWLLEWTFTGLFTIEYFSRLSCVEKPSKYALSFFGIVDLLSILPTYAALLFAGSQSLVVIRALRLLRIFRVLKIAHCLREARYLWIAFRATQSKILVFLVVIMTLVLIMGSTMYLVEGPKHGFTSIPKSVYWAIVTMTTVGYGDIAPQTLLGQTLAAIAMILGYGIIIVPTGVYSVEIFAARESEHRLDLPCVNCDLQVHDRDASFCKHCGEKLQK